MDAIINGDITNCADQDKQDVSAIVDSKTVQSPDNENRSNNTSLFPIKEISEKNINVDSNLELSESSKNIESIQVNEANCPIKSLTEHSLINRDLISNNCSTSKSAAENKCRLELILSKPASVENVNTLGDINKEKDYVLQNNTTQISDDVPLNVTSNKTNDNKNISESSVASTKVKANSPQFDHCDEINPINNTNMSSNKVLTENKILDNEHVQIPSNKINEEHVSKDDNYLNTTSVADLIRPENIPHAPEISCKDANEYSITQNVSESEINKCITNELNPLEQLNQHIKAIGHDAIEMHNYSLSKNNSDMNKLHLKESHKDNTCSTEDKRLKESDSFVFTEISKEETGFPEIFTGLVTIGKYISVKGDFTLRSSEALVESPSLIAPYLLKEPDIFPPRSTDKEQKDFFHSAAGEMLIGIGISCVNEWFHRDMTRIKKRQMKKEGKSPQLEEELKYHEMLYCEAKKANKIYSFPSKVCKTCGYTTESSIVMEGHLLIPHMTPRREFQCNFCDAIHRDPKGILEHMYRIHGKAGRLQNPFSLFECPYCTYENNSKVKLSNHVQKCQRFFDPRRNQAPPKDFEFPALTPKPITVAVVKAYEKSLTSMQRGRGRPKKMDNLTDQINQFSANSAPIVPPPMSSYRANSVSLPENLPNISNQIIPPIQMPNMNLRPCHSNAVGQLQPGLSPMHLSPSNRYFQVVNSSAQLMPMLGSNSFVTSPSQYPFSPSLVNSSTKRLHSPTTSQLVNSLYGSGLHQQNPPKSVPEVTITPLPKLQGPYPVPFAKPSTPSNNTSMQSNSLVVCEICDGYIKDLEQLRTHMQLIHKVKIHPKMLVSRPPLNCQKCQWRFFTDQGLERHLLGAHGLVTSNMQELANRCKDAGCCTICGRVYASKLVSHMNQVHKLTLKPAHLSYKCTVCSATFNLYRLFENHVYLVHSGAAKRPVDSSTDPSKKLKTSIDDNDLQFDNESNNHNVKIVSQETDLIKCSMCGNNFRKNAAQTDKCEKCLNFNINQGVLSTKIS